VLKVFNNDNKQYAYLLQLALFFLLFGFIFHKYLWFPAVVVVVCLPFRSMRSRLIISWSYLGVLMSKLTHPLFLGILYFLFLSPIAFLWRLFGNDTLSLKKPLRSTLEPVYEVNETQKFENYW
jgi:hypothetical protein